MSFQTCKTCSSKEQNCIEDIVKTVHVRSVVQPSFYEATSIFFVRKKNKHYLTVILITKSILVAS